MKSIDTDPFDSVDDTVISDIRKATNGNYALGNHRFKEEIETLLKRRARPGHSGRPGRKEESDAPVKLF